MNQQLWWCFRVPLHELGLGFNLNQVFRLIDASAKFTRTRLEREKASPGLTWFSADLVSSIVVVQGICIIMPCHPKSIDVLHLFNQAQEFFARKCRSNAVLTW